MWLELVGFTWIYPYFLCLKTFELLTAAMQDLMQAAKNLQVPWLLCGLLPASLHGFKPMHHSHIECAWHCTPKVWANFHMGETSGLFQSSWFFRAYSWLPPCAWLNFKHSFPQGFTVFSALLGLETAEGSKRQQRRFHKLGCSDTRVFDAVVANRPALGQMQPGLTLLCVTEWVWREIMLLWPVNKSTIMMFYHTHVKEW